MEMEKRIMHEKIESMESALREMAQSKAEVEIKLNQVLAENESLRAYLAMTMRDRELVLSPRIFN